MNNNYYTVKEIILSLRSYYLDNDEQLKDLRLEHYYDNKVSGINLNINSLLVDSYYYDEPIYLQYLPKEDKIFVESLVDTTIYKYSICDIFNYKIPKYLLSNNIIKLMENKKDNKELIISKFNSAKQIEFIINENDNIILLEQKNKKKIRKVN